MNPRLKRQVSVYATLLGLTLVYRLFAPDLRGDALGGLLLAALAGGVGVNHLYDEGYKTWAVVVICASLVAGTTAFYGLLSEGFLVALFSMLLFCLPLYAAGKWGQGKTPRKTPKIALGRHRIERASSATTSRRSRIVKRREIICYTACDTIPTRKKTL